MICALPACENTLPSLSNPGKPRRFCSRDCCLASIEANRRPRERVARPCGLCGRPPTARAGYCGKTCRRLGRLRGEIARRSLRLGRDEADLELAIEARLVAVGGQG